MRSLARDFSSSRRAPPMAASKPYWSSACFSAWVFITSVCTVAPWLIGPMPCAQAVGIGVHAQRRRRSRRRDGRGRRSSRGTSSVVSTCSSGIGGRAGWNAFSSRCSSTELSLPTEYSITGLRNPAATSRRMWMLSASSRSRWDKAAFKAVLLRQRRRTAYQLALLSRSRATFAGGMKASLRACCQNSRNTACSGRRPPSSSPGWR